DVPVPQCGQAVGAIFARVFSVADPNERRLKQAHDRRQNFFARKSLQSQIVPDLLANNRKSIPESFHTLVFILIANRAPLRVIPALLAMAGVAPRSLQVAIRGGAYPYVGPCGRNNKRFDASQQLLVFDRLVVGIEITETLARADAADSRLGVGNVAKSSEFGGLNRICTDF